MSLLDLVSTAVAGICAAGDKQELHAAIYAAIRSLGFDSYNLGCEKPAKREFMTNPTLTNWSYDDLVAYERDGWTGKDPLLAYAATGGRPLYWDVWTWQRQQRPDYLEYVKSAGLFSGVTVPIEAKGPAVSALTLLSWTDRKHDPDVAQAASIIGMVATARAAALGLTAGLSLGDGSRLRSLSSLQREILKWIAAGKSNSEIALIVGQSKRSIDYHVIEILKKLGVNSRVQAAAIHASA